MPRAWPLAIPGGDSRREFLRRVDPPDRELARGREEITSRGPCDVSLFGLVRPMHRSDAIALRPIIHFSREVHAVAALNHPNICHLYDVGPDYLVMKLVEGPTLAERIKQGAVPLD